MTKRGKVYFLRIERFGTGRDSFVAERPERRHP